jgi:hypothetical protein
VAKTFNPAEMQTDRKIPPVGLRCAGRGKAAGKFFAAGFEFNPYRAVWQNYLSATLNVCDKNLEFQVRSKRRPPILTTLPTGPDDELNIQTFGGVCRRLKPGKLCEGKSRFQLSAQGRNSVQW